MFDRTQGSLALEFARSLAGRDYARAHAMLSARAQSRLTPDAMREQFEAMIPLDWGEVAPIEIMNNPMWDEMFIYVVLGGAVYSEAVMVSAFLEENGVQKIDAFEFGRP